SAVERMARAKKISPGLTTASRPKAIASDGSTGASVLPRVSQCATWASTIRCTPISTAAQRLPIFEARIGDLALANVAPAAAGCGGRWHGSAGRIGNDARRAGEAGLAMAEAVRRSG